MPKDYKTIRMRPPLL